MAHFNDSEIEMDYTGAKDDYVFEGKEFEHLGFSVKIVPIPSESKFDELKETFMPGADGLQAFSTLNPTTNACTIYIKDPLWKYSPEWIGHEMSHCIWGRWHNGRDQKETLIKKNKT